jgi:glutamyl-tRNA reductase
MNLQVVYCNHQSASLSIREKLAFAGDKLAKAYRELLARFRSSEFVVLSTCNRVEVYSAQESPDAAPTRKQIAEFVSEFHHVPLSEFSDELLAATGPDAVRHLFRVASSLDSMVLGEPQIVNQVKEAYRLAQEHNACGPLTHAMFQGAIRVSARVRSETQLAEGRVSIASVAVGDFGRGIFDRFDDKRVLILGAGEMAEETVRYLVDEGVRKLIVVNRNLARAEELAAKFPNIEAKTLPWTALDEELALADMIVSTTGATEPVVDAKRFQMARQRTGEKPILILDLGAPRDFAPEIANLDDNVFLYDIDALEETCEQNRKARIGEINKAQRIIDEETDRFLQDVYHMATGPIIKRLREQWHEISRDELARLKSKLSHLTPSDLEAIERSTERIVNKLLHPPLEALRQEAQSGTPHGLLDALRRLFHLRD